jgi:hypothetical protein
MKYAKSKLLLVLPGLLLIGSVPSRAVDAPSADAWKPFHFLMGEWIGEGPAPSGQGTSAGEFSLSYGLDQKILLRRNRATIAVPGREPAVHEDLMIIYPQSSGGTFRAEYFDNEGHVIHYIVSTPERGLVFESTGPANGPCYKLSYDLKPDGQVGIRFAVAAPSKAYQTYLTGTVRKKKA